MQILFRQFVFLILILSIFVLTACRIPQLSTNPTPVVSSSATTSIKRLKPATRIVSLTSLSSDILYHLDKTKLVGVSGSKLLAQNPDLAKLPRVSEGRTPPNLEKIVALKPDLVIGAVGFHDQAIANLKSLGIQTLLWEVNSWRSLNDLTQTLADAIQANPDPLLKQYQTFLSPPAGPLLATLVLASRQPLLAPNKNSWAGDLLKQFGIQNIAAELQGKSPIGGYVTLSPEKVLEANPEVIILVDSPQGEIEKIKSEPFWSKLKATQNQRIYTFDYYGLVNPGSIEAIQKATTQLKKQSVKKF
jgi:iron complex transport system substrate-binding protein